jgi:acetyl-CoA carboxylase biotin carboxyl carrier protein
MAIELKMPALSPTMEEGTLAKWLVQVGDTVKEGDTICIIEAMKILNEIEADAAGTVKEILCQNGQAVEYGQALLIIE